MRREGEAVLVLFESDEGFYVGDFVKCKRNLSDLRNWELDMYSKFQIH